MFYNINSIFAPVAGVYVHIPFCKTRCVYCDFFSSVSMKNRRGYVDALCRELALRKDYLRGQAIHTIYLGGGTPSQLTGEELRLLFEAISSHYEVKNDFDQEITLEANPDDLTTAYLKELRELPFNRISIGVQSFHDKDLQFLNRRHNATQALEAIERIKAAGFENISLDLMYGLPGQTLEEWQNNLQTAIQTGVRHISAYHLIYEEGTPLYRLLQQGQVAECDEELSMLFFSEMIDRLTKAGFVHYEISNFALPGYLSRHNSSYWTGAHYLGVGPSAHSYDGKSRQWNVSSLPDYIKGIQEGIIPAEREEIDPQTAYNDYVLTGLRTARGIDLDKIERDFGRDKRIYCEQQAKRHLVSGTLQQENTGLFLSRKGIFLSDGIMSDLMFAP